MTSFLGLQTLVPHWGGDNLFFLPTAITAWQADTGLVHVGGMKQALFTAAAGADGGATGSTFITTSYNMLQDCLVRQIAINPKVIFSNNNIQFRLFRWNGTAYDFVATSENLNLGNTLGVKTFSLATPLQAQCGDVVGFYNPSLRSIGYSNARTAASRYATGDIQTTNAFALTLAPHPELDVLGRRPFLCVTGDSIPEGHNGAANWHGWFHDAGNARLPGGEPTSEIANQLRAKIGNGTTLEYQNWSLGSQTFAWVASTGIPACVAADPYAILIHCGVNDINTGRAWADVEADLDTIKTAAGTCKLLIDEILPWTAGNNTQAATVRTFNTNLTTWCAANGAKLIKCHDAMGQVRAATGELDDLLTAYDQDGVHLTTAGVDALAAIIATIPA